jgi:hypothetical protein
MRLQQRNIMTLIVDVNLFIMLSLRCRSLFNAGLWLRGRGTREASAVNLRVMPDLDDLDHNSASQSAACLVALHKAHLLYRLKNSG